MDTARRCTLCKEEDGLLVRYIFPGVIAEWMSQKGSEEAERLEIIALECSGKIRQGKNRSKKLEGDLQSRERGDLKKMSSASLNWTRWPYK